MCNGLRCLSGIDRLTGKVIRRYERAEPGDLIHIGHQKNKVKSSPEGRWKLHGKGNTVSCGTCRRPSTWVTGLQLLTCSNTTDHSRLAYIEALNNKTANTLCEFFEPARLWFRSVGVAVNEILTNNRANFKSKKFVEQLAHQTITHTFTKPYQPQTNTKH